MYLQEGQLIAIIRGVEEQEIPFVGEALLQAGIDHVEVSLSNPEQGLAGIAALQRRFGTRMSLGVGTVTNTDLMERALEAGARYIITPAWDVSLVRAAREKSIPIFPGVFTPAEVMAALEMGLCQLKLFPAATLGPRYIKDLKGPFPRAELIGVGGINTDNMAIFWQAGCHRFAIGNDLVFAGATREDACRIHEKAKSYRRIIEACR